MAETPQGSNNAGNVIGWIDKLFSLIKRSGIQNIFLTLMMLFVVIVVGQIAYNPSSFIKRIETVQHEQHQKAIEKRIDATPKIRECMLDLKNEINANRVFVMEAHNGGQNLTNLPFLYVDLTYAEPKTSAAWLMDEYINVRLSRYPSASKLFDETYMMLTIDELNKIDPEMYYRLNRDSVKYLCMMMLYSNQDPVGAIGATFTDPKQVPSQQAIKKALLKYGNPIASLLSNR